MFLGTGSKVSDPAHRARQVQLQSQIQEARLVSCNQPVSFPIHWPVQEVGVAPLASPHSPLARVIQGLCRL